MNAKRATAFILSMAICISMLSPVAFADGGTILNISQVRSMAIEKSQGYRDVVVEKIQKDIELKQAIEGIADIRRKENTIRFSLLFNIQWPEKHGLPKEIDLIMKVPQIKTDITILERQKPYEKLKSQQEAEDAFYDLVFSEYNVNFLKNRVEDNKIVLARIEQGYKTGQASKDDLDYMKGQLADYESKYTKALQDNDDKKRKLSSIIGQDVKVGYSFEEYIPELSLTRDMLEDITEFALNNDFEYFKKIQERKLAETDSSEILGIYKSRYGGYIKDIENYIAYHEGKDINYDDFIKRYNHTLTAIDSPWAGDYVIKLLFFKIRIPKIWFKGTYSGTRYMEDQKYALFVSLVERDKARNAEKKAKEDLENTIYDSYSTLKQMETAMQGAKRSLEITEETYKEKLVQNSMGLVDFASLESVRTDYYNSQVDYHEMQIEYAKALSAFNLASSGYINKLMGIGDTVDTELAAGESFVGKAQWYIENVLTSEAFSFGVKLPDDYDCDQFALYYNGKQIGARTSVEEKLVHLPFTYEATSEMEVRLYKEGEHRYTGKFDGGQYEGELELKAVGTENMVYQEEIKENIGSWNIKPLDNLRKGFGIADVAIEYDKFSLSYNGKSIGEAYKGEEVVTLGLYFSNIGEITVNFYNSGGELVAVGKCADGDVAGEIIKQ